MKLVSFFEDLLSVILTHEDERHAVEQKLDKYFQTMFKKYSIAYCPNEKVGSLRAILPQTYTPQDYKQALDSLGLQHIYKNAYKKALEDTIKLLFKSLNHMITPEKKTKLLAIINNSRTSKT